VYSLDGFDCVIYLVDMEDDLKGPNCKLKTYEIKCNQQII